MVLTIHLNTPPGGRSRIAKNFRSIRRMGIRASNLRLGVKQPTWLVGHPTLLIARNLLHPT